MAHFSTWVSTPESPVQGDPSTCGFVTPVFSVSLGHFSIFNILDLFQFIFLLIMGHILLTLCMPHHF